MLSCRQLSFISDTLTGLKIIYISFSVDIRNWYSRKQSHSLQYLKSYLKRYNNTANTMDTLARWCNFWRFLLIFGRSLLRLARARFPIERVCSTKSKDFALCEMPEWRYSFLIFNHQGTTTLFKLAMLKEILNAELFCCQKISEGTSSRLKFSIKLMQPSHGCLIFLRSLNAEWQLRNQTGEKRNANSLLLSAVISRMHARLLAKSYRDVVTFAPSFCPVVSSLCPAYVCLVSSEKIDYWARLRLDDVSSKRYDL